MHYTIGLRYLHFNSDAHNPCIWSSNCMANVYNSQKCFHVMWFCKSSSRQCGPCQLVLLKSNLCYPSNSLNISIDRFSICVEVNDIKPKLARDGVDDYTWFTAKLFVRSHTLFLAALFSMGIAIPCLELILTALAVIWFDVNEHHVYSLLTCVPAASEGNHRWRISFISAYITKAT